MQNRKCLIIDDDEDDREIFLMCLNQVNTQYECATFGDPVKALDKLVADTLYTPDYIFVDMNMPKMNGIQCLEKLRDINRLHDSRIYMYSTTSEDTVVAESERMGASGFIIKPAQVGELRERLSVLFSTDME